MENDEKQKLKTNLANLIINRITVSESLNILRDFSVNQANKVVDEANEDQLVNIQQQVDSFLASGQKEQASKDEEPEITPVTDEDKPANA